MIFVTCGDAWLRYAEAFAAIAVPSAAAAKKYDSNAVRGNGLAEYTPPLLPIIHAFTPKAISEANDITSSSRTLLACWVDLVSILVV